MKQAQNYVVAVSGGVDSMVLLDMLLNPDRRLKIGDWEFFQSSAFNPQPNLVVAHFDHGIRSDSRTDEELVRGVVGDYGIKYETQRAELGLEASEKTARIARYNFLRQCCKKYNALLLTAHHQDDLIETMLINLIRGTNWRGLISLNSTNQIIRPLLTASKLQLQEYAKQYSITWREDSTNSDDMYLRNYVRLHLIPAMEVGDPTAKQQLVELYQKTRKLKSEIAMELQKYISNNFTDNSISRYQLIMLPPLAALEVLYCILTQLNPNWHPSSLQLKRALHFIKTGLAYKELELSGSLKLSLTTRDVQFKKL